MSNAGAAARDEWYREGIEALERRKDEVGGQERSLMGKSTSNGHGLFLCPTASMLRSFAGRNYVTTSNSGME